jgi:hypothetical protein
MKLPIFPQFHSVLRSRRSGSRRREDGIAVIVVLALIVMVLLFLMGNVRTFYSLEGDLRLLEKQQMHRLQVKTSLVVTNVATPIIAKPVKE